MKFLTLLTLTATLALANPVALPLEKRQDCAETCKKAYTHCYSSCNNQLLLAPAPCARLCNVRSCKEESCSGCDAFATMHCKDLPSAE